MALPMDNIIFRFLLQCWPIIVAVIITVLLIYSWMRLKITAEKLQRGLIQQSVLRSVGSLTYEEASMQEWIVTYKKMEDRLPRPSSDNQSRARVPYRTFTTISLVWVLFWVGASTFVSIRILFNPIYYGGEAIFLGYFLYYALIGLISYFRR